MPRVTCTTLALALLLLLAACGTTSPVATLPPTAAPTPPRLAQLAAQRAKWDALGITDYDITIRETRAFNEVHLATISVRGGQVPCSGSGGSSGFCPDTIQSAVPWLFAEAKAYLDGTRARQLSCCSSSTTQADGTTIGYDATYGFPYSIVWDLADFSDEEVTIRVASFTPLPPGAATPAPTTQPPPTMTPVPPELAELASQRARWQALNITDYDLVVRGEYAFSITTRYAITVRGGQVRPQESSCQTSQRPNDQCQVGDVNQYTVPGLFAMAEQFLDGTRSRQMGLGTRSSARPSGTAIFYDPTYGFPSNLTNDLPEVYDDQVTIRVVLFTRPGPATPSPATPSPATPSR